MKNSRNLVLLFLILIACNQKKIKFDNYTSSIKEFQFNKNKALSDPATSPFAPADLKKFNGLSFYPIDSNYRLLAKFVRTPHELVFEMPTSTSRTLLEVKYGEAHFTLKGIEIKLSLFQDQDLISNNNTSNYLFLPFTDKTSGLETYGGGRYIDLEIPKGDSIIIDFNKSYNPYCVYNDDYSCAIPPRENNMSIAVEAGIKDYKKEEI